MAYQPNIPNGTVNLDEDWRNLRTNFQALNTIFDKDHVPYSNNTAQNGYHKAIHIVPQAAPATVAGIASIYSTTINSISNDQTLFYKTGAGNVIQLTRNFVPLAANHGYTFLPGGLMLQWGRQNAAGGATSTSLITFATLNKAFPTSCFAVWATPFYSSAPNGNGTIAIGTISATSFAYTAYFNSSANYSGFYWTAIGI